MHTFFSVRPRVRGQATFLALAALLFLVAMTLAVFNVGQVSYSKTKSMDAADAAAFAASSTLARDMNFMAYTNRAMVANHVAVGQFVSLVSLTQSIGTLARNSSVVLRVVGLIPGLQALQTLASMLDRVKDVIERIPPLIRPLVVLEDQIVEALDRSQQLMRVVTVKDAASNMQRVIRENDPNIVWENSSPTGAVSTVQNLNVFLGYSTRQGDRRSLDRFRQVTNESRDKFTAERKWMLGLFRGATHLRDNNQTWTGLDGMQVTNPAPPWTKIPVAWGGAQAGPDKYYRPESYGGLASKTANLAYAEREKLANGNQYRGLRPYFDLRDRARNDAVSASSPIVVVVRKPLDKSGDGKSQTSDKALSTGGGDNPYRLPQAKPSVLALAAGQVYFKRPSRAVESGRDVDHLFNRYYRNGEYASLFSPYWQARLTEVPAAVTAAAQAMY